MNNNKWITLLLVILGNFTYALSVKLFVLPVNLISCGTTGLAFIAEAFLQIPMSGFILAFNVSMLILGWCILGRQFAMTTLLSSLFYPVALEVLNLVLGDVYITDNMLLNVLFAGMGVGGSLGLVLRGGASTGGMDIPPLILKKFFHTPVSASLWVFDFCIMTAQMSFHPLKDLLYGILLLITISVTLNKVMRFGTSKTEVKIISEKSEEIRTAILAKVNRGVTILHGQGGYLRQDTEVILTIISNHQLPRLEQQVRAIDPDCFIIITSVTEVWGRGFTYGKRHL